MSYRRERFRAYMARINGAADPATALAQGFYVAAASPIADRITARMDLQPTSTHLVVGGVGSGKTTQLLVTRDQLCEQHPGALVMLLDLSQHVDLSALRPGALLASVGLMLSERAEPSETVKQFQTSFRRWAHGYWLDYHDLADEAIADSYDADMEYRAGVVTPPSSGLDDELATRRDQLQQFLTEAFPNRAGIFVLIDSLDRMSDLGRFRSAVEQDVAALASIGVGLVVVGPLRALYGMERELTERFDYLYRQPTVDVNSSEPGARFLFDVLRKRADSDILPDASCEQLVTSSGGVVRDLLRLAHQAGDEAYLDGADTISPQHVARAADAFGRTLMLGLTPDEVDKLHQLHATGSFVRTSPEDLALVVTRRILDYQDARGTHYYAIHPTLVRLLQTKQGAA